MYPSWVIASGGKQAVVCAWREMLEGCFALFAQGLKGAPEVGL